VSVPEAPTIEDLRLAGVAYTAYAKAVGNRAYNGDPLPTWDQMQADPAKARLVEAWTIAASAAVCDFVEHLLDLEDLFPATCPLPPSPPSC